MKWAVSTATLIAILVQATRLPDAVAIDIPSRPHLGPFFRHNRHGEEIPATQASSASSSPDSARYAYSPWNFPASLEPSPRHDVSHQRPARPVLHSAPTTPRGSGRSSPHGIETPSRGTSFNSLLRPSLSSSSSSSVSSSSSSGPSSPGPPLSSPEKKGLRKLAHQLGNKFRGCAACGKASLPKAASRPTASSIQRPIRRPRRSASRAQSGLQIHSPGRP